MAMLHSARIAASGDLPDTSRSFHEFDAVRHHEPVFRRAEYACAGGLHCRDFHQRLAAVFGAAAVHEAVVREDAARHVEHEPADLWRSVLQALQQALAQANVPPASLVALGLTNQRETTVLWDRATGVPVRPGHSGDAVLAQINREIGDA